MLQGIQVRVVDQLGGCGYTGGQTFWVDLRLDLELKVVLQVDLVRVVLGWGCTWLELYLVCILLVVVVLGQSFSWLQLQLILLGCSCAAFSCNWLYLVIVVLVRVILGYSFTWLQLQLICTGQSCAAFGCKWLYLQLVVLGYSCTGWEIDENG